MNSLARWLSPQALCMYLLACCVSLCVPPASGAPADAAATRDGGAASVGLDLVRNGDFEIGPPDGGPVGWSRCSRIPAGAVLFWSDGDARTGKRALGIRSTYAADRPWFWWEQWIPLRGARTIEVRGFVRSRNLNRGAVFVLRFRDAAGRVLRSSHIPNLPKDTAGKWILVRRRLPVPRGAEAALFQFSMHGSGEILLDDLQVRGVFTETHHSFDAARVAPAVRTSQPIRIDGRLDDWAGVPELHVRKARDVSNAEAVVVQAEESRGAADLSFGFRLAFDDRALYLGVAVRDNVRRLARPFWAGDSIQFAIDTQWRRRSKGYGPGDFAFAVTPPAGGTGGADGRRPQFIIERRPQDSRLQTADIPLAAHSEAGAYTIELALPWRALGVVHPRHNTVMGFTILVNDSDGAGRKWAEWTPGIAMGKSPAQYGVLVLFDDPAAPTVFPVPPIGPLTDARRSILNVAVATLRQEKRAADVVVHLIPESGERASPSPPAAVRRGIELTRGVASIPFVIEPDSLTPGPAELRIRCGSAVFAKNVHVRGLRAVIRDVSQRMDRLREKLRRLQNEIAAAREAGADVAYPDATCVTAEYFLRWIIADVSREGDETLAQREARRLEPLLDRALEEIAEIRRHPAANPRIPTPDIRNARLQGGNWTVGERPVFFIGLNQLPLEVLPDLPRFGGNFVTIPGGAAAWTLPGGPAPDRAAIRRSIVARAIRASKHPVRINVLFGHRMPAWAIRKYPDITAATGHFMDYDISHPMARRLTCIAFEAAAAALRNIPYVTCYDVWNEAGYWKMSERALSEFRKAMRKRYATIEALNREWGTNFTGFAEVRALRDPQPHPAAYFDWVTWNDERVAEFAREMRDAVRRGHPGALVTMKISNEAVVMGSRSLTFGKRKISAHGVGIDRWKLARIFDLQGCDTRPTLLTPDYAFAWRYPGMAYDLQRSMAPDKPIDDSEWHAVQTVYFTNEDQPGAFLNAALWFSYLHGMDMNITWWWSRTAAGEPKPEWFRGSLLTQPQLLAAWARNNITVQRFAPEIVAFQEQKPRVRLLFSKPSAVLDLHYLDTLFDCYESLSWFGVPLGFATEQMLFADPPSMDVLVVPAARHASAGVRGAVAALERRGVQVIRIGPECLALTPHGKPVPSPAPLRGPQLPGGKDLHAWYELLRSSHVLPPVRCMVPGGFHSKPVAFRTVDAGGRRLAYIIGLGKEPARVELRDTNGAPVRGRSLLTGAVWDGGPRDVAPCEVDLLEILP